MIQQLKSVVGLSLLVFLFTFYHFDPTIESGLDPSYAFGLNYIFAHKIPFGTQVVYTYGPLGFLYFPQVIGANFLIGLILVSLLRFGFIYSFLRLGSSVNKDFWPIHTALAFFLCSFLYLDFILVAALTCLLFLYDQSKAKKWLLLAAIYSVCALLIKSSFGVLCASIAFSYSIYSLVKSKNQTPLIWLSLASIAVFIMIWLILYQHSEGMLLYLYGTWQLSSGNSSAMILEVSNNWWLFGAFLISFFLAIYLAKDKQVNLLYSVSILALIASWKYAFAREENYHLKFLFDYLVVFAALFLLVSKTFKPQALAMVLLSILLYFQSMKATGMYQVEESLAFDGIKNFSKNVVNYNQTVQAALEKSAKNLQNKKLSDSLLSVIGNQSIDFFPWELTYAAANQLNWQPRPNLQSGAYTPWLDKNNANFIASKNGPEFYLWEMDKPNGGVDCFDSRYYLNDEPHTIFTLFNKYELSYADSSIALFKRQTKPRFSLVVEGSETQIPWNTWIKTPEDSNAVLRIKAPILNNLKGSLRKAIFKDIIYFVDYQLADSSVKTYRIVKENAANGLWVAPHIQRISDGLTGLHVRAIRFHCSNQSLVADSISVQWQLLTLAKNQEKAIDGN